MTYQEIKDRLTKCEVTLEKLKDGSYIGNDIAEKTQKLELIKESLQNQLAEAEKGMVATDDENKAKELADKGVNVKLTSEMKPGSEKAAEHERFKRLSAKDQETINKIRSMMQAEKDSQNEVVDPSITQILVDFVALLGMGYGALEAVKKLGDKHGDISVDSIIKALKGKQEMDENEAEDTEGGDLDVGHQDDEPDMLKQYAYDIATYAAKLYKQLDKYDKMDGEVDFPNWWQSKVILAREYISKAQHYLEFEEKQPALDQLALEESVNEGQAQIKKKLDKINQALQQHKDKTIAISKTPADQRSEEDKAHLAKMVDLTKMKKQLTAQYDDAVSGMGAGQELDANISERVGGIDEFISLIQDRAADSDFPEEEEAVEVIEAIAEHYGIDIEFGRLGDTLQETNEEKGSK